MVQIIHNSISLVITVQLLCLVCLAQIPASAEEESRECREQEYKDQFGNCKPCKQCDAGQELSKECGFGYGEDARCVPCRTSRFKEDQSVQKCKPCLDCGLLNRFQKSNCSTTNNAVCGECLPGYYRKTKLSGFQDMECIPCGDPPPQYEPQCSSRVNLVPVPSVVTSPRDMALAAVICSALATVLLALLVLCVIYCKRQLLEKKPSVLSSVHLVEPAASLRSEDCQYGGAEMSCLDPCWLQDFPQGACCQCHLDLGHTCGPVHMIPSLCCEEKCSLDNARFCSHTSLNDRNSEPDDDLAGHAQTASAEAVPEGFRNIEASEDGDEGAEEGRGPRQSSAERRPSEEPPSTREG
ncbi:tumor necrosis factor receptor superfamily member 19-like isoform X1 [Syngnathus typhle]|uniref:tumor necrosis factor receptor superfamily member 19-like isoform X1 n=1 Tax=Syngnathus typhle TaxID=161592 RepID=UPI002A6B8E96|nr:tumor necrosis factor receptor superfamily member 19-like isoform X1 [Syngnathus typhle]